MNFGYSYSTVYTPQNPIGPEFAKNLPIEIMQHAGCKYACTETPEGLVLNPTERCGTSAYRPCIRITRCGESNENTIMILGEPARFIRIFMCFWYVGIGMIAAFAALIFLITKEFYAVPFMLMAGWTVFGYLYCKMFTKMYYNDIVAIIKHTAP